MKNLSRAIASLVTATALLAACGSSGPSRSDANSTVSAELMRVAGTEFLTVDEACVTKLVADLSDADATAAAASIGSDSTTATGDATVTELTGKLDGCADDASRVVNDVIRQADTQGASLDRECMTKLVAEFSSADLALLEAAIGDDSANPALSAAGEATKAKAIGCIDPAAMVDMIMSQMGETPGLDTTCVRGVIAALTPDELSAIVQDGGDPTSQTQIDLQTKLVDCVDTAAMVDEMMAQMGDASGLDADCVRGVFETLSAQDLVAIGESGGDISSPAYATLTEQLMACATGETTTTG